MLKEKRAFSFIALLLFMVSVVFSQRQVGDAKFNEMLSGLLLHSVNELLPLEVETSDSVVILDARELVEYKVSHIKEALWVGYDSFNLNRVARIPKNKKIIVYCSVGYRSEKIAEKLLKAGYINVSNLYGGIFEWVHASKKVYNKNGETKAVHTFNKEWSKWLFVGEKKY